MACMDTCRFFHIAAASNVLCVLCAPTSDVSINAVPVRGRIEAQHCCLRRICDRLIEGCARMAGQYGAETGCRRIVDANDGIVYFMVADVHEDAEDIEHSTFDLQVTDGTRAWQVQGMQAAFAAQKSRIC